MTPSQQSAVERTNQDVCVVAGPGSGKTRVLIERFAWLVEFHNVNPARILAITFTEKAATEIKQRLIKRFVNTPEHREAIERAWVSTIDGFCARVLQENAIAAGIPTDFAVLDQTVADRLARESLEESLDQLFAEDPSEMRRLLESLDLSTDDDVRKPDLAASLLDIYASMRIAGVTELPPAEPSPDLWPEARRLARNILEDQAKPASETPQLVAWAADFLALEPSPLTKQHFAIAGSFKAHLGRVGKSRAGDATALKNEILPALLAQWIEIWNAGLLDLLREAVARLDRGYRKKKRDRSALDFADLEEEAIRLLESNYQIQEATRARFDQILMDELQDTNRLQWRLVNLIRTPDAFFAVGDINQSIYGFRHADPAVFEEYRDGLQASGGTIDDLRENHRSRQQILDVVSHVLDGQPGIEPRPLIAAKIFPPAVGPCVDRLVGDEASLVADRIRQLVESGECEYKDIAILVRSLNSLEPFTRALDSFGIPFVTTGGRTFLEAREIRDLMALLAALVNPLDEIALVGVLRSPPVGLSDEEIFRIGRQGWQELFQSKFGHLRKNPLVLPIDESLTPRARANVDKLFSYLRRDHRPLAEILDDLEYLSEAEAPPPEAGNVVQLMSIHAAKGLEFKVVFVSALHRGADSSTPGLRWRNPATGEPLPVRNDRKHEENRLLYVAMTRAEERLFLTYTKGRNFRGWNKLVESIVAGETAVLAPLHAKTILEAKVRFVDPPVVTGQHDSSVEVSSIQLFEICPRKYFLSDEEPLKTEGFDFMLAVEDVVLYGQIDHWFEEDGELIVVGEHAFEVRIYALALERYLGRLPDRALLRGEPPIEISLSLNDLKAAKNTVKEFVRAHNVSLFPLQEGEHCRRCAFFRGLCPAGKT
jgi:ATP-dependent helicase/nuclease subunit A